jgi:hypothetical protein
MTMYIDPHIHMLARTTADYEAMAAAGIVAIIEPAFWIGQPRTSVGSYIDYLSTLVGWERFRAAQFGIRHYCSIGLNSKEANNERLGEEVMEILPRFLLKEGWLLWARSAMTSRLQPKTSTSVPSSSLRRSSTCWSRFTHHIGIRSVERHAQWTSASSTDWRPTA